MSEFRMPTLGADMEAGTLASWQKQPGDTVKRGDIVAVVETQKGAIEVEVFEDGVIERLLVQPGERVPVGTPLAIIRETARPQPERTPVAAPAVGTAPAAADPSVRVSVPADVSSEPRQRVSPVARKLAADRGVDLSRVTGSGPQGAITREDVERAIAAAGPRSGGTSASSTAMRAAIAAAMTRSKRESPHYYLSTTIDMGRPLAWMRAENEKRPVTERLLPAALLLKATALALRSVPELNGHWLEDGFHPGTGIHIGVAIFLRGGGLVAPALRDADRTSLPDLMRNLQDLVARARAGSLRSGELTDPTITVTNLGDQGVESTFGIIHPPQVAIVGFGKIADRPWVIDGRVEVRPLVTATLSADHRATDGHQGGALLAAIDRLLQAPEAL